MPLSPPKGRRLDFVAPAAGSGWEQPVGRQSAPGGKLPDQGTGLGAGPGLVNLWLYCFAESMTLGVPGVIPTTLAPEAGEVRRLWLEGLGRFPPKCELILRLQGL